MSLPRLLAGLDADRGVLGVREHERVYGPMPRVGGSELIDAVQRSGLRGRGGADFPTARKLRAVAARRRVSAVVVNGSETEPASGKDRLLLAQLPHLVLDGAVLAARAVGAREVIVKLGDPDVGAAVEAAVRERPRDRVRVRVVVAEGGYVAGEETAVVQSLNGGAAVPTFTPPRVFERGYLGRPTLVQNPETLAQIALIARHGPDWFRSLGTADDPGTVLVTVSGAIASPGVIEVEFGSSVGSLVAAAGGAVEPLRALLIGGYFGTWVSADRAMALRLARADLQSVGASLGAGVVVVLGESSDGLRESARVVDYLARQSAGQCGPCVHGLRAIADSVGALAAGTAASGERERVLRWAGDIRGRGACHHPDGAIRFVLSALREFGDRPERELGSELHAPAEPGGRLWA